MNPVPILPNRLDWPSTIGNFPLNFGTLEYLVFVFLKDHLPPEEFDRVKEHHLKDGLPEVVRNGLDEAEGGRGGRRGRLSGRCPIVADG
jgi:hypothetical protein